MKIEQFKRANEIAESLKNLNKEFVRLSEAKKIVINDAACSKERHGSDSTPVFTLKLEDVNTRQIFVVRSENLVSFIDGEIAAFQREIDELKAEFDAL